MKVWHFTPYSTERNLGAEYNAYMELIPYTDSACMMDGDAMHLVPNWGHVIEAYANKYPDAILTCWINRIHKLSIGQHYPIVHEGLNYSDDVTLCLKEAKELLKDHIESLQATPIVGPVSGTLLVIPKHIWEQHKFSEVNTYRPNEPNLLGADNYFTNKVRAAGIPVLRMNSLLIYHQYRLLTGTKEHLL